MTKPKKQPSDELEPAAFYVPTKDLVPWKQNPRDNQMAIAPVARAIREYGFGAPLVVQEGSNRIIAGHTRFEAAKILGLEKVPVRFMDVSDEEADQMSIADNKLGEKADWRQKELAQMLGNWDREQVTVAGFSDDELESLLKQSESPNGGGGRPGVTSTVSTTYECPNCGHKWH